MTKEKVIDILKGIKDGTACLMPNMPEDGEKAIDIAIKVVEQFEPPTIQPKRGRWEEKDFKYHCSCCDGIAPKAIRWDFCPHCGADMREVTT